MITIKPKPHKGKAWECHECYRKFPKGNRAQRYEPIDNDKQFYICQSCANTCTDKYDPIWDIRDPEDNYHDPDELKRTLRRAFGRLPAYGPHDTINKQFKEKLDKYWSYHD